MPLPLLPLRVQADIEQQKSWEGISTPQDLAQYLSRVLSVDPNSLANIAEITFSSLEPTEGERGKIWIKTSEPVAIGIPVGGAYRMIYEQPPGVPYLVIGDENKIPSYARKLTASELTSYNLQAPDPGVANWSIINL